MFAPQLDREVVLFCGENALFPAARADGDRVDVVRWLVETCKLNTTIRSVRSTRCMPLFASVLCVRLCEVCGLSLQARGSAMEYACSQDNVSIVRYLFELLPDGMEPDAKVCTLPTKPCSMSEDGVFLVIPFVARFAATTRSRRPSSRTPLQQRELHQVPHVALCGQPEQLPSCKCIVCLTAVSAAL